MTEKMTFNVRTIDTKRAQEEARRQFYEIGRAEGGTRGFIKMIGEPVQQYDDTGRWSGDWNVVITYEEISGI